MLILIFIFISIYLTLSNVINIVYDNTVSRALETAAIAPAISKIAWTFATFICLPLPLLTLFLALMQHHVYFSLADPVNVYIVPWHFLQHK